MLIMSPRAPLDHERSYGTGHKEGALEVGVENAIPIVFGFFLNRAEAGITNTGVIDEKSDRAELSFGGVNE